MENKEMVKTTKKSKGLFVGLFVAATAAVGTLLYKKFKKNEVEVEEPALDEKIFEGIEDSEVQ